MYRTLNRTHYSHPKTRVDEEHVQPGLAVTPAQMYDMMQRGIPVAQANLGLTYDEGVPELEFAPSLEYARYPDMNTMWEYQQEHGRKVKQAVGAARHAAESEATE